MTGNRLKQEVRKVAGTERIGFYNFDGREAVLIDKEALKALMRQDLSGEDCEEILEDVKGNWLHKAKEQ